MDDDWDLEEDVQPSSSTPPPPPVARAPVRNKWADEDEDDNGDDWDKSEDEKPKATAAVPAKKKKTLKQIIAEKEAKAAEAKANGGGGGDDEIMDTLTTQERRRLARERELEADLAVAGELMGNLGVEDDSKDALQAVLTSTPKTKEDFAALSRQIITAITARHQAAPLYSAFVEQLSKDLCESLTAVQTRKVSSALSVLGNTKQQEERDKASGKKKTASKPKLGATKTVSRVDTEAYDDVLEDDDFM